MDLDSIGKLGKALTGAVQPDEAVGGAKKAGGAVPGAFESVRQEQLQAAADPTGPPAVESVRFEDTRISRAEARQVEADFMRQVRGRGDGQELAVLGEHIGRLRDQVTQARDVVPKAPEGEFGKGVRDCFEQAEQRFQKMEALTRELQAGDRQYSMQDLLRIQVQIQNVSQNLEVMTRAIDKMAEGIKTVLRTQV